MRSDLPIRKSARQRPTQRGVMLIEVLVSILIFSFGILGTVALYARAVQYSTNAEDRSRAALLANELASAMWTNGSVTLPNTTITSWQARAADVATYGLPGGDASTVTVTGNTATITVIWTPTFSTAPQQFVTQVTI